MIKHFVRLWYHHKSQLLKAFMECDIKKVSSTPENFFNFVFDNLLSKDAELLIKDINRLLYDEEYIREFISKNIKDKKLKGKINNKINDKSFKVKLVMEAIANNINIINIEILKFFIMFYQFEIRKTQKANEFHIDEDKLSIESDVRKINYSIKLYECTVEKLKILSKKYNQYKLEDIIYMILKNEMDLYVFKHMDFKKNIMFYLMQEYTSKLIISFCFLYTWSLN